MRHIKNQYMVKESHDSDAGATSYLPVTACTDRGRLIVLGCFFTDAANSSQWRLRREKKPRQLEVDQQICSTPTAVHRAAELQEAGGGKGSPVLQIHTLRRQECVQNARASSAIS